MVVPMSVSVAMSVTLTLTVVVTGCRDGAMQFFKAHMLVIVVLNFISTLMMSYDEF